MGVLIMVGIFPRLVVRFERPAIVHFPFLSSLSLVVVDQEAGLVCCRNKLHRISRDAAMRAAVVDLDVVICAETEHGFKISKGDCVVALINKVMRFTTWRLGRQ